MNKKILIGLSVVGAAAGFWACGDGDVITKGGEDEMVLAAYTLGTDEESTMKDLVKAAMDSCSADPACAAKMEGSTYVPPESSAEGGDTPSPESSDGNGGSGHGPVSSNSGPVINTSASTTPTGSSGSGGDTPPASSAATVTDLSKADGTCSGTPTAISKGGSVTWTFKPAEINAQEYGAARMQEYLADKKAYEALVSAATCDWTLEGAATTSVSGTCGGDAKTVTATYPAIGDYSASIKLGEKTITCKVGNGTTVAVSGTAVTDCECSVDPTNPDLKDGPVTVTWSVSGCMSGNAPAEISTYTWTNATGVAGTNKATAQATEKGQVIAPSVDVKSTEFAVMSVKCPSVKANNSSDPICEQLNFEIDQWNSNKNIQQKFEAGCYDINTAKACSNAQVQAEGSGTYKVNGDSHNCNYFDGTVSSPSSIINLEVGEGCTVKQLYLSSCS